MKRFKAYLAVTFLLALCACDREANTVANTAATTPSPALASSSEEAPLPSFVGKIWVSITPGHARGSILVFLPDRSVLQDSCFETFRVSKWGIISDTRIRWIEDSIPIEAEYSQPSGKELVLEPVGTGRRENYVAISVPYVCPDMPR